MSGLDLLVLGDVNPDVIVAGVDDVPFGQAERLVERASLVVGGSAAITACGAARLGLSVGLCGVVGDDDLGRFMTARLVAAGVDLARVRVDPARPTGLSVVLDRGGDRAILTAPGTIGALSPDDLSALPDRPARHVHVASYYLMAPGYRAALPEALRRFRAAGVTTSLDPNWDPSGAWDLAEVLAETTVFLPNHAELMAVTRASGGTGHAMLLARAHGCDVVVKQGSHGAVARTAFGLHQAFATSAPRFVDAVGAGDSFDAGYLAGLLAGLPEREILRLAVAVGTLSTRGAGGTAAQPDRAEADAWAARLAYGGGDPGETA